MNLVMNEEQRYLKTVAREFFENNSPIQVLRNLRDSRDRLGYSEELWQKMVDLGWTGIIFPESVGGLGFGFKGLGAVIEESGRTLAATPLLSSVVLCGSAISLGCTEKQQQEILPILIGGEMLFALAVDEGPHHNPVATAMPAKKVQDGYQIDGNKTFVMDGHIADKLIVAARTSGRPGDDKGITLFMIDADSPGITRTRTFMIDGRNAANLTFDRVTVDSSSIIGDQDDGYLLLEQVLDRGRIFLAAEMLGSIQECFDRTILYLKTRKQFGVFIGTFQALQHRAAQMFMEIELTRSAVMASLSSLEAQSDNVAIHASLAKYKASETFELVSNEAIQLHGGIGITDELDIGLFLKRACVAQQTLGSAEFHRDRYAAMCGF